MMNRGSVDKFKFLVTYIIVFFAIYELNIITPLFGDDWIYMGVYGTKDFVRIESILQIFESQYNHYLLWSGRSIVHFFDQFLLMLTPYPRAIIKSLCFILFIFLIYTISTKGAQKLPIQILWIIIFLVFTCYLHFEEVMLWTSGMSNYLFSMVLVLIFLLPYYFYFLSEQYLHFNMIRCILLFLFGIITGWTQENIVAALFFIVLGLFLYLKIKRRKIPRWSLFGVCGLVIGYALLILAPGNFIRIAHEISSNPATNDIKTFQFWSLRIINLLIRYKNNASIITLNFSFLILFILVFIRNVKIYNRKIYSSLLFFIAANISSVIMIASTSYPERATFPMITLLIIAISILVSELYTIKYVKLAINLFSFILFILLISIYKTYYLRAEKLYIAVDSREHEVKKNIEKGDLNLVFPEGQIPISNFYWDFLSDKNHWINNSYSRAYGLESVRTVPKLQN